MRHISPPAASGPFIAWALAQDWNALSLPVRQSCEKHIRSTLDQLTPMLGAPAVEGIIIYDQLQCGAAVANMLWEQGMTLPRDVNGEICNGHFDEDEFCRQTNAFGVFARLHAGSKGMLITLNGPEERRLLLLDQRQASLLHPMGRDQSPEQGLAAVGLLAHELSHARDYAAGRPGKPTPEDIEAYCAPAHAEAIAATTDMALAEYVATRDECSAQVMLQGACSQELVYRAETMARQQFSPPSLTQDALAKDHDAEQRAIDLSAAGYTLGTLAAYAAAKAPVMGKGGTMLRRNTSDHVHKSIPASSPLGPCLAAIGPALDRAARAPDHTSRGELARAFQKALLTARMPRQRATTPRETESSLWDCFDEL